MPITIVRRQRFQTKLQPWFLALVVLFLMPSSLAQSQRAGQVGERVDVSTLQARDVAALLAGTPTQPSYALQESAWAVLEKGLKDHKASHRVVAVDALTSMSGNPRALSLAESALTDKDAEVRQEAAARLGDMGAQSSVPKLIPLLKDKSPEVVFAAARALAQLGDPSGRDVLIEVLSGERKVGGGIVGSGRDWARTQAGSPLNLVLMGGAETGGILLGPYIPLAVTAIRQLTIDHQAPDRAMSAQALSLDGSERVVHALQTALEDDNWMVRAAAADALGRTLSTASIPYLEPLLKDKHVPVRFVAASAIIRLSTRSQNIFQAAGW